MMAHFLTADIFRKALKNYFINHRFGNVNPDDLFESMNEEYENNFHQKLSVGDIMDKWVNNPGYPIVQVENIDDQHLNLKQYRFSYDDDQKETDFIIPISVANGLLMETFNDTKNEFWLKDNEESVNYDSTINYVINVQQTGYYR